MGFILKRMRNHKNIEAESMAIWAPLKQGLISVVWFCRSAIHQHTLLQLLLILHLLHLLHLRSSCTPSTASSPCTPCTSSTPSTPAPVPGGREAAKRWSLRPAAAAAEYRAEPDRRGAAGRQGGRATYGPGWWEAHTAAPGDNCRPLWICMEAK